MLGRNGFEVHNPQSRYRLKSLEGEFSGLALGALFQRKPSMVDTLNSLNKWSQMAGGDLLKLNRIRPILKCQSGC